MAIEPVHRPISANRWVPFFHSIFVEGIDLTGASFALQVRDRWNGGVVRADLATVGTASAEGVRIVAVTALPDSTPVTELGIRINEATMEAMPIDEASPDGPAALVYDLHVTRTAGRPEVWMRGAFTVVEGSTE